MNTSRVASLRVTPCVVSLAIKGISVGAPCAGRKLMARCWPSSNALSLFAAATVDESPVSGVAEPGGNAEATS